ncbi:hypothetical protein Daura_01555 [Dactylosporangium aurantiacum]|uniref:Uncharacterized protein n=1 Tax=Dactylosporangium aurantiacum TaxID=35754 RepID=A0A9Q9MJT2_9ACTN|nr:hypothetical protein [Dactylosporangium aurantiacum]MDG6100947.1 hypothetical protein [Dactylosporangium aurantiacum]UWZ55001.1 hypothetical protein Daura_01555 [Dactylosporangium aurantiacum]
MRPGEQIHARRSPLPPRSRPQRAVDSVEQGIRDLAQGSGPSIRRIADGWTPGLRRLRDLSSKLAGSSVDERADAMLRLIYLEAANLGNSGERPHPRCAAAVQAALGMPTFPFGPADDSINRRLQVAREAGAFDTVRGRRGAEAGTDAGKINWSRGVVRLARAVERRVNEYERPGGWEQAGLPSGYQPVTFNRMIVTYFLRGRAVSESFSERWITAEEDGLTRYIVRAYARNNPPARPALEIQPWLNCTLGSVRRVDPGDGSEAQIAEMLFPKALQRGDKLFFATRVVAEEDGPTMSREVQVTSHGIDELTIRIQFDNTLPLPKRAWWFAEVPDIDRLIPPEPGDDRYVEISGSGFLERQFGRAKPTAKYGLSWQWD